MALTTQDSGKLAANLVTDATAADAKRAARISPEFALMLNKSIVARPLATPEVCSIHVKNTEYRYRWVNVKLLTMRKAQGWLNATTEDVNVQNIEGVAGIDEIRSGDLILMKIRADMYDGAIKWNIEKAARLSRARGMYLKDASSDVMSDATPQRESVSNEPFVRSGLAKPFIPDNPDAIVEDSISSGRVKKTRETMEALKDAK